MKKIFVTGGSGFIGKEVVRVLADTNKYELIVLTRKVLHTHLKRVESVKGDILDKDSFRKYIDKSDIILHIAGIVVGSEEDIRKVNIEGTKNIIEIGQKKKLIFISSENVLYNNQSMYGESKKVCEKLVQKVKDSLILRISAVYGKYEKKNLGKIINWCKKFPFIFIPGNGKSLMQPIFVNDVAMFITNAIKKNKKGIFIIAGPSKISLNEFIDLIAKILNKKIVKIHLSLALIYPFIKINEILLRKPLIKWSQVINLNTNRIYNMSKTIQKLGHSPVSVEEGLSKILKNERYSKIY